MPCKFVDVGFPFRWWNAKWQISQPWVWNYYCLYTSSLPNHPNDEVNKRNPETRVSLLGIKAFCPQLAISIGICEQWYLLCWKMLANYNKIPQKLLFMPPRVESVVQRLHFQIFGYVLNLFVQHHHANSQDRNQEGRRGVWKNVLDIV